MTRPGALPSTRWRCTPLARTRARPGFDRKTFRDMMRGRRSTLQRRFARTRRLAKPGLSRRSVSTALRRASLLANTGSLASGGVALALRRHGYLSRRRRVATYVREKQRGDGRRRGGSVADGAVRRRRWRASQIRPLRSRRRRASGRLARSQEQKRRALARPARIRDQQATEPLPLRGRATIVGAGTARPLVLLKGSNASRRTSAPDRTIFDGLTGDARIGGRAESLCRRFGEPRVDRLAALPVSTPGLVIAISGAVLCCSAMPLRHRRVCASPAITDLSRIALSGDRLWRLRSIRRRVKRASKDSGVPVEGLR